MPYFGISGDSAESHLEATSDICKRGELETPRVALREARNKTKRLGTNAPSVAKIFKTILHKKGKN